MIIDQHMTRMLDLLPVTPDFTHGEDATSLAVINNSRCLFTLILPFAFDWRIENELLAIFAITADSFEGKFTSAKCLSFSRN